MPYPVDMARPLPHARHASFSSNRSSDSGGRSSGLLVVDKKPVLAGCTFTQPSGDSKKQGWKYASQRIWSDKTQEEIRKLAKRQFNGSVEVTSQIQFNDLPIEAQRLVEEWILDKRDLEKQPDLYTWQLAIIKNNKSKSGGLFSSGKNSIDVIIKRSIRDSVRNLADDRQRQLTGRGLRHAHSADDLIAGDSRCRRRSPSRGLRHRGSSSGGNGMDPVGLRGDFRRESGAGMNGISGVNGMGGLAGMGAMGSRGPLPNGMAYAPNGMGMHPAPGVMPGVPGMGGMNAPRAGGIPPPPMQGRPMNMNGGVDPVQIISESDSDSDSDDIPLRMPNGPRPGPMPGMGGMGMNGMPPQNFNGMPRGPMGPMPGMQGGRGMPPMNMNGPMNGNPNGAVNNGGGMRPPMMSGAMPQAPFPPNTNRPMMGGGGGGGGGGARATPMMNPGMANMGGFKPGKPGKPIIHQPQVVRLDASDSDSEALDSGSDYTVRTPNTSSSFGEEVSRSRRKSTKHNHGAGRRSRSRSHSRGPKVYREHRRRSPSRHHRRRRSGSDHGYVMIEPIRSAGARPRLAHASTTPAYLRTTATGRAIARRPSELHDDDLLDDDLLFHERRHADSMRRYSAARGRMETEIRDLEVREKERQVEAALRDRVDRRHQEKLDSIERKLNHLALEEREDRQRGYAGARAGLADSRFGMMAGGGGQGLGDLSRDLPLREPLRHPLRDPLRDLPGAYERRGPLEDDLATRYSGRSYQRGFERRRPDDDLLGRLRDRDFDRYDRGARHYV